MNTFLDDILQGGGDVYAKYHADMNKCRVLTKYQKIDLNLSRPRVYVNDTTFGKNSENFKVYSSFFKIDITNNSYYSLALPCDL